LVDDLGLIVAQLVLDALNSDFGVRTLADDEAQAQLARHRIMVERESGRIRSAMLTAIEHVDERFTDLGSRTTLLKQNAGYTAHGRRSSTRLPLDGLQTMYRTRCKNSTVIKRFFLTGNLELPHAAAKAIEFNANS